jgi:hypothetical protein
VVVVSNSSPLIYLAALGDFELLPHAPPDSGSRNGITGQSWHWRASFSFRNASVTFSPEMRPSPFRPQAPTLDSEVQMEIGLEQTAAVKKAELK